MITVDLSNGVEAMGLPLVLPKDLQFGQYYVAVVKSLDDAGNDLVSDDLIFINKGSVVSSTTGQPKKVLMFLKSQTSCFLSQLGEPMTFFGPLQVQVEVTEPVAPVRPKRSLTAFLNNAPIEE
jgi:hypothetical protein